MDYPFGLQLHSLRHEFAADPEATLRSIPALGFDHIECTTDYGWSQEQWLELLADTGLSVLGAHVSLQQLEENFNAVVDFYHGLGACQFVVPSALETLRSVESYAQFAQRLSRTGARLKAQGLELGYHNHAFEFEPLAGSDGCGLEILVHETDPEVVMFQVDPYWMEKAGRNSIDFIRQYMPRIGSLHAKELRLVDGADVPVGQGNIDFEAIIPLAVENEWPILVEFEGENAADAVKQSAIYLSPLIQAVFD